MNKLKVLVAVVAMLCSFSMAQTKPERNVTKIQNVLLYNKIGGWVHVDGRAALIEVMEKLSNQYGFEFTSTENEGLLDAEFLSQFDLLVWNNNTDGGQSVTSPASRNAVLNFIRNGGGWLPVHGAGDHADSWIELRSLIGTTFSRHGAQGNGTLAWDSEADGDPELKMMLEGHDPATLYEEWYSFQNSPRGQEGFTMVASVSGAQNVVVSLDNPDPTGVNPIVWAKREGEGRVLYTAIGHVRDIYTQQNNWNENFFWDEMRFVAGDFAAVSGCTNPDADNYNPDATTDDGSCEIPGCTDETATNYNADATYDDGTCIVGISLVEEGQNSRMDGYQLNIFKAGFHTVKLHDFQGKLVEKHEGVGAKTYTFSGMPMGVYYLSIANGDELTTKKIVIK